MAGSIRTRVVLITGAGGGIGSALSIALITAGHSVGAADCDIKSVEELAKSLGDNRSLSVRADLTSEADFTKDHGDEGQNR